MKIAFNKALIQVFTLWKNNAYRLMAVVSSQQEGSQHVWCADTWYLVFQRDLLKDLHGLKPVEVICGIRWRCFLLAVWHLSLKQQSFVVSWLNLSFQGDPNGWLKSWWFDIMRFAMVHPQRLHSNACLPSPARKIFQRGFSLAYEVRK